MIIAIDDTDSREGMCTTYLCAALMDELKEYGNVIGSPILIRLNPTIPYKTRGNASTAFEIKTENPEKVMDHVISRVEELAELQSEMTNPGIVFIPDNDQERVKEELRNFFLKAVREVLEIEDAKNLIAELGLPSKGLKNGRGLIGALAACGAMLNPGWDYTYEYLAYRERNAWGTPREVDEESVRKADLATYPDTWDTVDCANDLVVCVPHAGDPVLFGIRGNSVDVVTKTSQMIESEPVERYMVYRTDQGTDLHLIPADRIADIRDMHSYTIEVTVATEPETIRGGHTIFSIQDEHGDEMDCAAYEPTKNFREVVRKFIPGDRVVFSGSVKNSTLNIEKMKIVSLEEQYESVNPTCTDCGKRMKSAGKGQGYRCKKCGTSADSAEIVKVGRDLETGTYEVPPCARRHLAMPLVRCQDKKKEKEGDGKIFPSR
ncbi:tRNA(Ile)(2)-agmatinylcytidine synthase [Methanococcoides methylutens]|uniref:tRNA(Ile2) 2-agmatinylcytidine synthetase TiaS n=1 Tax=Methanococcoides methylutens MM1 TaxID=1434104 RepID=A0A0E3WYA7_METMT|nr:tRNA(Ile)(2)-agmatinylcytidine synthase [Methanococcoides methylutens]AKB84114.1 OB-fold nucleic acid binding domain protein [Methanococcoides methylutens MM1]